MKKKLIALCAAALGALLIGAVIFNWSNINFPWSSEIVLQGNTPSEVKSAQPVGHNNTTNKVKVVIGMKLRNESQLDALLAAQGDPNSPDYQKYLTPQDFANQYAPTQADYDDVVKYLQSQGLTVIDTPSNRMLIGAEGTVAEVEKTFGVKINQYSLNGRLVFSNDADPRVPARFANTVGSVIGLDDVATFHSMSRRGPGRVTHSSPVGLTPGQVATVYNYPNTNNPAATDKYSGKGKTIAIATVDNYLDSDANDFWKQFGISRTGTVTRIAIGGKMPTGHNDETTLDLQQIGAQAPGADILMYLGVDPEFSTFTLIFNTIATDNKADVVSVSWGACEKGTGAAQMKTENTIFKQLAAQGTVVFAASGDDGAYDCGEKKPSLSADYPASDPLVVAVGGTTLYLDDQNHRSGEIAWSGAGGAESIQFSRPAWQVGTGLPAGDKRESADVSLVADPWTGYTTLYEGSWQQAGGTSFAAPDWAAQWILVDEASGKRVGSAHALIYRLANSPDYGNVFYDVTSGNNGAGRGPGYNANKGWDHPTGWGSPDTTKLAAWVKQQVNKP